MVTEQRGRGSITTHLLCCSLLALVTGSDTATRNKNGCQLETELSGIGGMASLDGHLMGVQGRGGGVMGAWASRFVATARCIVGDPCLEVDAAS